MKKSQLKQLIREEIEKTNKHQIKEGSSSTKLLHFYLFDPSYGEGGNPKSLSVFLRQDGTIGYSYYGGWQPGGGMPFAISNMQLRKQLPLKISGFKNTKQLESAIADVLRTGVGSSKIKKVEHVNEIPSSNNIGDHSLQNLELINPTHIILKNSGHGEFPDSYQLTPEGVKYILKNLNI